MNRRRRSEAGEWEDATATFHTVRASGQLAENLATLDRGSPVIVVGEIVTDQWTDKASGETRTKPKVLATAAGPDYSLARLTREGTSSSGATEGGLRDLEDREPPSPDKPEESR